MSKNSSWNGLWSGRSPRGQKHERVRQVISPSGGIVRGKFPSRKNGRMVHHEGLLELDAIYLFETSPQIIHYREQPETIRYPDEARLRRYTPDFELTLATGELVFIEVKPVRSLENEEVRHKLACISFHLSRCSKRFVILDERVLRQEPRQSNLRAIYHQTPRLPLTEHACRAALHLSFQHFPLPISDAVSLLGERGVDPYSLLLIGLLFCNLDKPITPETLLYLSMEKDDVWFRIAQGHGF